MGHAYSVLEQLQLFNSFFGFAKKLGSSCPLTPALLKVCISGIGFRVVAHDVKIPLVNVGAIQRWQHCANFSCTSILADVFTSRTL